MSIVNAVIQKYVHGQVMAIAEICVKTAFIKANVKWNNTAST